MIKIKRSYKSSVRLDENFSEKVFIDNIVLHGTALNAIEVLSKDFSETQQRCFTLTGPYGSGKSTLALFLSLLLTSNQNTRILATEKLNKNSTSLDINNSFNLAKGWKVVKHVCGLENPAYSIAKSISESSNNKKVEPELEDSEYLNLIEEALNSEQSFDGVVLLLDEMGKALDFQSRENKDLYFFQQLADIIQRSKNQAILIGFLHQSFSEYSRSMTAQVQREWAKVQGRYRDISYSPSIDESLVLVADTLSKDIKTQSELQNKYCSMTEIVGKDLARNERVIEHLNRALPLDPVVSLLLGPISKRSFSQNERSLFGFLASNEKLSFNQFVKDAYANKDLLVDLPLYNTEMFWDYLLLNLDHVISSSRDSQIWLEAKDAVYRSTLKGGKLHESITKVIGLITLFGYQHHLFASKEFIRKYFNKQGHSSASVKKAINDLEEWSVIIYRPNHAALTIFQGSDVDVNELVSETIDQIKDGFDWTKDVDLTRFSLASAHYHKTGTMRWVQASVISAKTIETLKPVNQSEKDSEPFLQFVIPSSQSSETAIKAEFINNERFVIGHSKSIESLKTYALELTALKKILKDNKKITHDRIAKTEITNRILVNERLISQKLDKTFATASWNYAEDDYVGLSLSTLASNFADKIFNKSPVVINELVNRSKPSGSANAAIKKLILAMAENYSLEDLDFPKETFPAEKGLYYSCIKHFGLHQKVNEQYEFTFPTESKLATLFEQTHKELVFDANSVVWLSTIDEFWKKKPYGLTKGIRTIWLMSFVLVHLKDYAFYDKNETTGEVIFIAEPDDEFALKLFQKPQNVAVQAVHIDPKKTAYLTKVAGALDDVSNNNEMSYSSDVSPLKVAEGLVTFFSNLSNWTTVTNEILPKARKFIETTKKASDPHDYLFRDLPSILETPIDDITQEQITDLLRGLKNHHQEMINKFEYSIKNQMGSKLTLKACETVINFTSDFKLRAFAQRLNDMNKSNNTWVSNIISLLSSKSERNWDDAAIRKAESLLPELIEKFQLALHRARFKNDDIITAMNKQFSKEISAIKKSVKDKTAAEKRSILIALLEELEGKEQVDEF